MLSKTKNTVYSVLFGFAIIFLIVSIAEGQRPTFATKDTLVNVLEYSLEYCTAV